MHVVTHTPCVLKVIGNIFIPMVAGDTNEKNITKKMLTFNCNNNQVKKYNILGGTLDSIGVFKIVSKDSFLYVFVDLVSKQVNLVRKYTFLYFFF